MHIAKFSYDTYKHLKTKCKLYNGAIDKFAKSRSNQLKGMKILLEKSDFSLDDTVSCDAINGKILYHLDLKKLPGLFIEPNTLNIIYCGYLQISNFEQIPQLINLRRIQLGYTPMLDFSNIKISRRKLTLNDDKRLFSQSSILRTDSQICFSIYSLPKQTHLQVQSNPILFEFETLFVSLDGDVEFYQKPRQKTIDVYDVATKKKGKIKPEIKEQETVEDYKHLLSHSALSLDHFLFHYHFLNGLKYVENDIHLFLLFYLYSDLTKISNKVFWYKKYNIIYGDNLVIAMFSSFTNIEKIKKNTLFIF